eukprot:1075277-Prorocentrum_minimum.AAC.1
MGCDARTVEAAASWLLSACTSVLWHMTGGGGELALERLHLGGVLPQQNRLGHGYFVHHGVVGNQTAPRRELQSGERVVNEVPRG